MAPSLRRMEGGVFATSRTHVLQAVTGHGLGDRVKVARICRARLQKLQRAGHG